MLLSKCVEIWLETKKDIIKPSSYRKYQQWFNKYIITYIDIPIINIDSQMVFDLIYKRLYEQNKLSPRLCNTLLCVLREFFDFVVQSGYISKNPCENLKRIPEHKKEIEVFDPQECELIEEYVSAKPQSNIFGVLVSLYTGVRIGELLALTWQDVDFENRMLIVNKTISETGEITSPKSKTSVRTIPLHDELLSLLEQKKQSARSKYLIETKGGKTRIRVYQNKFERLLKKQGISHRGFHALRHTFATRLIEYEVDIKTVSTLMGHSNYNTTLSIYVHVSMDMQRKAIQKLKIKK